MSSLPFHVAFFVSFHFFHLFAVHVRTLSVCLLHSFCFHTIYVENRANKYTNCVLLRNKNSQLVWIVTTQHTQFGVVVVVVGFLLKVPFIWLVCIFKSMFSALAYCFVRRYRTSRTDIATEQRMQLTEDCVAARVFSTHLITFSTLSLWFLRFIFKMPKEITHMFRIDIGLLVCAMCDWCVAVLLSWPRSCQEETKSNHFFLSKWREWNKQPRNMEFIKHFAVSEYCRFLLLAPLLLLLLFLLHLFVCVSLKVENRSLIYHALLEIFAIFATAKCGIFHHWKHSTALSQSLSLLCDSDAFMNSFCCPDPDSLANSKIVKR